ncbi:MAG: FtsK/SpoIIIE domain-containing protein [Halanaerobiales bacterium]
MNELQHGYQIMWQTVAQLGGISSVGVSLYYLWKYFHPEEEPPEELEKLDNFFENINFRAKDKEGNSVNPYLINHEKYDNGNLFIYTIPNGRSISELKKKQEALSHSLKGEVEIWNRHNRAFIRSYTEKVENKIYFDKKFMLDQLANAQLGLPIGYSHKGFIMHDLSKHPGHMAVGGTTRYGKSNLIDMMITCLLLGYNPDKVLLNLLDYKNGVEFQDFCDFPHIMNYSENPNEVELIFEELKKELVSRMKLVKKFNKKNVNGLNIPYIITFIDEIAVLHGNKDALDDLTYLTQQGAAAGLFFVISTQRPEVKYVPGAIKTNCDTRISLKMISSTDSKTILDNGLAAELPPIPGRAIYQHGEPVELQVPFMQNEKEDDTLIKELLEQRMEELAHKKGLPEDIETEWRLEVL